MILEILQPEIIIAIFAASFLGIMIGAIPGMTATMGAALLVPFTLFLDPLPGMAAIIAMAIAGPADLADKLEACSAAQTMTACRHSIPPLHAKYATA